MALWRFTQRKSGATSLWSFLRIFLLTFKNKTNIQSLKIPTTHKNIQLLREMRLQHNRVVWKFACHLFALSPQFLTPFYRRAEVSTTVKFLQVLCKMGAARDRVHSSTALATHTVLPARCWRHKGQGGLVVVESWKADHEAEETEIHRKWGLFSLAACGSTC